MKALITIFLIATSAVQVRANGCFDDAQLRGLQTSAQQRGTLIYVWSPRMVYSVQNMAEASQAAASAGLQFIALHDRRLQAHELPATASSSQALCSEQLIKRDAQRHFPTAFVIGEQGMHIHPIVGAMPVQAWMSSIQQRLAKP